MIAARSVAWLASLTVFAIAANAVLAQSYPNRPIRIVTGSTGGGGDFVARIVAQGIADPLGQAVVVDNRAGGTRAEEAVQNAPPDGYSVLVAGSSFMFGNLLRKIPYDPTKDFAPISIANKQFNVLVVNPAVPVKSVKELIALAEAKPGQLNYGYSSIGGSGHLSGELFKSLAKVNIVPVGYKSSSAAVTGVLTGELQLVFADATVVAPHAKSGKLRALAITASEPSVIYAGLPTVAASGLPGYEWEGSDSLWTTAKTPAAIVSRLNQEIVRVLNQPEVKAKFLNLGIESGGSSPEQLAAKMASLRVKVGKLVKEAGIKVEEQ